MDYVTEIGGVLSIGNPMSHFGYWDDDNVTKPIARKLVLDEKRLQKRVKFKRSTYLKYIRSLWNT